MPFAPHTLIVIPTYNERTNLPVLVQQVIKTTSYSMLIVDDRSPDGTGAVADQLAAAHPDRISVLHRTPPRGLGRSYLDGFSRALELGAELICQMDADLSHGPQYLPALIDATQHADVAVGSRYVTGVSVANWPLRRLLLSVAANRYVRLITGLGVYDATSGFKCWRRTALAAVLDKRLRSRGYALQVEMLFHAARNGSRITEVPIVFYERIGGVSKMSARVIVESFLRPIHLVLTDPFSRRRVRPERPLRPLPDASGSPPDTA